VAEEVREEVVEEAAATEPAGHLFLREVELAEVLDLLSSIGPKPDPRSNCWSSVKLANGLVSGSHQHLLSGGGVFAIPDLAGTSTAPGTGTVPRHNTEKVRLTSFSHVPPGFSPPGVRPLIGRDSALEVLDDLLSSARAASSVVLVVRGGPGLGKTALLEHAIRSAADLQVARAAGVEAELDLPHAALHQLLTPFVAGIGEL